jgi:hypothetical protein
MTVTARFYPTAQQAHDAYGALLEEGFRKQSVAMIEPAQGAEDGMPIAAMADAIKAGSLLAEQADFFVSNLQPGYSLVVVEPPFGATRLAADILERFEPLDLVPEPEYAEKPYVPVSQRATPLSDALGWRVLSNDPTPFSDAWGFNVLSSRRSALSRWFAELTSSRFSLSSKFGLPLLSRDPAPLSSRFGLALKTGQTGQRWTTSMGLPLLTSGAAPLSSKLGLPVLSRRRWLY